MAHIDPLASGVASGVVVEDDRSYVDWPAILAGTVLATAISLVLLTFGTAIGLSMASAEEGSGVSLFWLAIVTALWVLWVQISSFTAGGYLAGRLRRRHGDSTEDESDVRDGSHGVIVWATGILLGAFIAVSGVSGALTAATTAVGGAASAVAAAVPDDADPLLVDRLLRGGPTATGPVGEDIRGEVGRILLTTVAEGQLDDNDRDYLVSIVAAQAGVSREEAETRIDQIVAQAEAAEQNVREAAETARRVTMIAAFIAAASLLVSAAGAYFGATLGGKHRDQRTLVQGWYRPW